MTSAEFEGSGQRHGVVILSDHKRGSRLRFQLRGLPAGDYTVEIHEGGSCGISFEGWSGPEGGVMRPVLAGEAGREIAVGPKPLAQLVVSKDGLGRGIVDIPELSGPETYKGRTMILRGERLLCGQLQ